MFIALVSNDHPAFGVFWVYKCCSSVVMHRLQCMRISMERYRPPFDCVVCKVIFQGLFIYLFLGSHYRLLMGIYRYEMPRMCG